MVVWMIERGWQASCDESEAGRPPAITSFLSLRSLRTCCWGPRRLVITGGSWPACVGMPSFTEGFITRDDWQCGFIATAMVASSCGPSPRPNGLCCVNVDTCCVNVNVVHVRGGCSKETRCAPGSPRSSTTKPHTHRSQQHAYTHLVQMRGFALATQLSQTPN